MYFSHKDQINIFIASFAPCWNTSGIEKNLSPKASYSQPLKTFEKHLIMSNFTVNYNEKVNDNDKPWINPQIKKFDRKRKREYTKNKKSLKWKYLNDMYNEKLTEAKEKYYNNIVKDLKTSDVGKWYSKLKRMSSDDQSKCDNVNVNSLIDFPQNIQAEKIADSFQKI